MLDPRNKANVCVRCCFANSAGPQNNQPHRLQCSAWIRLQQDARTVFKCGRRNVYRHEEQTHLVFCSASLAACFERCAAHLDQSRRPRYRGHYLVRITLHISFSAGSVVLGQKTDRFEKLGTELVVKILGQEPFGLSCKPTPHVFRQPGPWIARDQVMNEKLCFFNRFRLCF